MRRRTFLTLMGLPALSLVKLKRPTTALAATTLRQGLVYSDSVGTSDLSALCDGKVAGGIEYLP